MFIVVSKNNCPWCNAAIEELDHRGEEYEVWKINKLTSGMTLRTIMIAAGITTVPQVFNHEGKHIGGYDELVEYFKE